MNQTDLIKQHLIDPEICIRCNTCESVCPVAAVTHDANNYVVDVERCNLCMDCIAPCPTGSIDNWRNVTRATAYSIDDQFAWETLPDEMDSEPNGVAETASDDTVDLTSAEPVTAILSSVTATAVPETADRYNASVPPWSAAHPYTNLYGPKASEKTITATVTGNFRVTEVGTEYDTHHIVLDFGETPFPVLEGQSIGVMPPGADASGKPHHARQYSVASARNGERPGYNNISLTIKRVLEDYNGNAVHGVASNYMCDLEVGEKVKVIGPFGHTFLMPNHPRSNIVMICTGTGSAPMRAMTEWRHRLRNSGKFEGGRLMLFFGARSKEELPYFGPLKNLPADFIDINFAFSRVDGQPKRYVQDVMRERADDLAPLVSDPNTFFYVCGLKAMESGVIEALHDICTDAGLDWESVSAAMKKHGRLHLETY